MDTPSQENSERTPDAWSGISKTYSRFFHPYTELFAHDLLVHSQLMPDHEVLDIGTGCGALSLLAASHCADVQAIDFSPDMLQHLEEEIMRRMVLNIDTTCMDGSSLKFPEASFDRIYSNLSLIFFPDREAGLREIQRVLRPGGKAGITGWRGPEHVEAINMITTTAQQLFPHCTPDTQPSSALCYADPEVLREELEQAGFAEIEIHVSTHPLLARSPEDYWECFSQTTEETQKILRALDEDERTSVKNAVVGTLRERFGTKRVELTASVHIGIGTAP